MKRLFGLMGGVCLLSMMCVGGFAQEDNSITQTVRGAVVDAEAKAPLMGASVSIDLQGVILGATTDAFGEFRLEGVPVGRHDLQLSYLGYEPIYLRSLLISSGKELVLSLEMIESIVNLESVEISAEKNIDKTKPLNAFATVSSRTFSVEETSRYAAASFDPARMAQNYAGVSTGATDDLFNEIVIRGNTPSGILWRLEGVEIPNPNHFGSFGNGGGAISMLSSTTLSNSDFYTGAFPAEFGNATSGVFDLNMRNGNNEERESSFMFGALGLELGTEGPFKKGGKSSYLINYRYSTLAVLQAIGVNPTGDVLPTYQDLSFKFNFPTSKAGTFSLFGLGGNNLAATNPEEDSTQWESNDDREGFDQVMNMGVVGLSHRILLSDNSYLRTVLSGSYQSEIYTEFSLNNAYSKIENYRENVKEDNLRLTTMYHHKIDAKTSVRIGGIITRKNFRFFSEEVERDSRNFRRLFNNQAESAFIQGYGQEKHRLREDVTLNVGLHYSLLTFNDASALEPRAAVTWTLNERQQLTISSGLHSKMESLALYSFSGQFLDGEVIKPKKHLGLTKSWHNVIGYDFVFRPNLRLKAEAYYQHMYNVPIRRNVDSKFSILNTLDIWGIYGLDDAVAEGTARNIGLDITLERFFSNDYYFMFTGSIYDSKYKAHDDVYYNTRFNGNYQANILGGKEFRVGRRGHKTFGLNGKVIYAGGARYTDIDLPASVAMEETVFKDEPFAIRAGNYYRLDLGLSYKVNKKKTTHTIMFDIQNVTNRLNPSAVYFDDDTFELEEETLTGLFPFFNYRIEF